MFVEKGWPIICWESLVKNLRFKISISKLSIPFQQKTLELSPFLPDFSSTLTSISSPNYYSFKCRDDFQTYLVPHESLLSRQFRSYFNLLAPFWILVPQLLKIILTYAEFFNSKDKVTATFYNIECFLYAIILYTQYETYLSCRIKLA